MAYAMVSSGFRPGGGDAVYPTSGAAWGGAFAQQNYTSGKWQSKYEPDRVVSYELGEKSRMLDRRLTVNASIVTHWHLHLTKGDRVRRCSRDRR
jgi:outer membrane receptor for monomeric catechols